MGALMVNQVQGECDTTSVTQCLAAQISKKKYKSMSECKNLVDEALDRIRECTESCTDELQKKTIAESKRRGDERCEEYFGNGAQKMTSSVLGLIVLLALGSLAF